MTSTFEVDTNCSYCLGDVVAALEAEPTVRAVEVHLSAGCLAVTHDTTEARLAEVIAGTGHRFAAADNAEVVQASLHPVARSECPVHR